VAEMLLPMHIDYTSEFGTGQQPAGWLLKKATAHKTKFETDQKNRLEELTKKKKAKEEEHLDAAKNRKAVTEASAQLVAAFQQFSTPPAQVEKVRQMVEQKISTMKTEIMQEIGAKMEENSKEVKDTLASILDLLHGNSANRNEL
jgi:signal recognition particle subunit SEC65